MYYQTSTSPLPIKKWIYLTLGATLIQFIIFKVVYPYPNFLPDSYSYLTAASTNQDVNIWPIGYSKFLRFFSSFTHSDIALVLFQYLSLQTAILYLLWTIANLFHPGKWPIRLLSFFGIVNPLWLYISNFISSDALFSALSIVWFTQLLWIGHQPRLRLVLWHAIVIMLLLTIRFNAAYYPLVSIAFLFATKTSLRIKLSGIGFLLILISAFVWHSYRQYQQLTQTKQVVPFGGWQLAANALYGFAHVPAEERKPVQASLAPLHQVVTRHVDSLNKLAYRPDSLPGVYYLWNEKAPLKTWLASRYQGDTTTDGFKRWATVAPLYQQYGVTLIRQYPQAYFQYFIRPNMMNYYSPETEFLGVDNMEQDTIGTLAKNWFQFNSNKVHNRSGSRKIIVPEIYPPALAVINILFVLGVISFLLLAGSKKSAPYFTKMLGWMVTIWILNFLFSVLASPIVLRYQVFPLAITSVFMVLLVSFLIKESTQPQASSAALPFTPQLT